MATVGKAKILRTQNREDSQGIFGSSETSLDGQALRDFTEEVAKEAGLSEKDTMRAVTIAVGNAAAMYEGRIGDNRTANAIIR